MDSDIIKMILIRFGIFAGLMLFCTPFLIGFAFRCIEPIDFGISYNANSKKIDSDKLYYSGRHYVGLGHFFKRFPIHQLAMIFSDSDPDKMYDSIKCRSKEGLQLHIHIFLAYKLTIGDNDEDKIQQLMKIYNRFEFDYDKFLILMVHSVIRNVAAEYSAFDFFEKRSTIGDEMFTTLKEYFEEYYFSLRFFYSILLLLMVNYSQLYIINMEIPESFDESILETEIVNQQIEEKTYLKSAKMIEGNTSVLEAEYDAQILILKAKAEANKTLLEKQAIANSTKYVAQKQLEALKSLKTELALIEYTDGSGKVITIADQILDYIWIYVKLIQQLTFILQQQLKQMKNVVLGVQQPVEFEQ